MGLFPILHCRKRNNGENIESIRSAESRYPERGHRMNAPCVKFALPFAVSSPTCGRRWPEGQKRESGSAENTFPYPESLSLSRPFGAPSPASGRGESRRLSAFFSRKERRDCDAPCVKFALPLAVPSPPCGRRWPEGRKRESGSAENTFPHPESTSPLPPLPGHLLPRGEKGKQASFGHLLPQGEKRLWGPFPRGVIWTGCLPDLSESRQNALSLPEKPRHP
jgi:hypothetical protein